MQILVLLLLIFSLNVQAQPLDTAVPQYERVYSVQVATYEYPSYGQRIAQSYADIPFLCRERSNGLFTLYYGVFESHADAKLHLRDYGLFSDLNAYVVKLKNVSFEPCANLGRTIEDSKGKAFSRRECADCDVRGLVETFLPDVVVGEE